MLTIPSVFSHSMVLQRQKKIHVWGSLDSELQSGLRVVISLNKENNAKITSETEVNSDGSWTCALPPQKEGGPYSLVVELFNSLHEKLDQKEYADVMIGEVWLAGGQSNMEYELCNDTDGKLLLENLPDIPVRYYYTPKIAYIGKELEEAESKNTWQKNGSPEMKHWSAAAYFAVKKMSSELKGITFGIIGCNWGGSISVNWMDIETSTARTDTAVYQAEYEEKIRNLSDEEAERLTAEYKTYHDEWNKKVIEYQSKTPDAPWKDVIAFAGECKWPGPMTKKHEFRPGGLYQTMIKRIAPYSLRGFLYYQGESDDKKPHLYRDLLSALIFCWRKIWKDDELFFMIFQLTVYTIDEDSSGCSWAIIRQAQEAVFKNIKNTGLTVISDCGERRDIHPKAKKIPGERAGEQILSLVYNRPFAHVLSPLYRSHDILNGSIRIHMANAKDGLMLEMKDRNISSVNKALSLSADTMSVEENPFVVWDESGSLYPADVRIEIDPITESYVVILSSSKITHPVGASYGWANWFNTMLYGASGLPASPFTTKVS